MDRHGGDGRGSTPYSGGGRGEVSDMFSNLMDDYMRRRMRTRHNPHDYESDSGMLPPPASHYSSSDYRTSRSIGMGGSGTMMHGDPGFFLSERRRPREDDSGRDFAHEMCTDSSKRRRGAEMDGHRGYGSSYDDGHRHEYGGGLREDVGFDRKDVELFQQFMMMKEAMGMADSSKHTTPSRHDGMATAAAAAAAGSAAAAGLPKVSPHATAKGSTLKPSASLHPPFLTTAATTEGIEKDAPTEEAADGSTMLGGDTTYITGVYLPSNPTTPYRIAHENIVSELGNVRSKRICDTTFSAMIVEVEKVALHIKGAYDFELRGLWNSFEEFKHCVNDKILDNRVDNIAKEIALRQQSLNNEYDPKRKEEIEGHITNNNNALTAIISARTRYRNQRNELGNKYMKLFESCGEELSTYNTTREYPIILVDTRNKLNNHFGFVDPEAGAGVDHEYSVTVQALRFAQFIEDSIKVSTANRAEWEKEMADVIEEAMKKMRERFPGRKEGSDTSSA